MIARFVLCLLLSLPALSPAGERLLTISVDGIPATWNSKLHTYVEDETQERVVPSINSEGQVEYYRTARAMELNPFAGALAAKIAAKQNPLVPDPPAEPSQPKSIAEQRAKTNRTILPGVLVPVSPPISTVSQVSDKPNTAPALLPTPSTAEQMLSASNKLRAERSLSPHVLNAQLTAAAQDHADYMARTGQFSHYVNNGPSGRAAKHGFNGGVMENIAVDGGGRGPFASLANAFTMWRNSGGHYAAIMSNTTQAGFGYAKSANGSSYYVGVYGNLPKAKSAIPAPTPKPAPAPTITETKPRADIQQNYNNYQPRGIFRRW